MEKTQTSIYHIMKKAVKKSWWPCFTYAKWSVRSPLLEPR